MEHKPCLNCGGTEFEDGFIDDVSSGRVRWLPAGRPASDGQFE
jgi:hypothetical protein